ncbi:hypothetical protein M1397_03945 [Candidatus Marsarchaeota archaeon]|nr:hypothetical protein [Candidatus Marsarchaeota archaeon]
MDQRDFAYIGICLFPALIVLGTTFSYGPGWGALAALFTLIVIMLILAINWIDFIIFPMFTKFFGITIQPSKDYSITKGQDAILKSIHGLYYATGFTTANLFPYTFKTEEQDADVEEKMLSAPENWERAVTALSFPFKFHVLSVARDVQMIRDELEGKRSYQEFQLSQALQNEKTANETTITNIRRKINVIQANIDRIAGGEKPISTIMYFETTAIGVSEKAALDALSAQITQLKVAMSSLNLQIKRIAGRELYKLFTFNFALPLTYSQIADEFSIDG